MGQFPATVGKETSELNGRDNPAAFDVTSMPFARLRLRRAGDEPHYKSLVPSLPSFSTLVKCPLGSSPTGDEETD